MRYVLKEAWVCVMLYASGGIRIILKSKHRASGRHRDLPSPSTLSVMFISRSLSVPIPAAGSSTTTNDSGTGHGAEISAMIQGEIRPCVSSESHTIQAHPMPKCTTTHRSVISMQSVALICEESVSKPQRNTPTGISPVICPYLKRYLPDLPL